MSVKVRMARTVQVSTYREGFRWILDAEGRVWWSLDGWWVSRMCF